MTFPRLDPSSLFLFGPTPPPPLLFHMADDAQDTADGSRKRARVSDAAPEAIETPEPVNDVDDDDDDDIGPMPMPDGAAGDGAVKKKRKGARTNLSSRVVLNFLSSPPP